MIVEWVRSELGVKGRKRVLAFVVVTENAIAANGMLVSYSRSDSLTDYGRYNKNNITNNMLKIAVDRLTECGYLQSTVGEYKQQSETKSPSFFWATQTLLDKFPRSEVEFVCKSYADTVETVLLRDDEKNLVDYIDTRKTDKMNSTTKQINTINGLFVYQHMGREMSNDGLVRIFNQTFDKGGRYYRSDIQQIKQRDDEGNKLDIKETRLGLLIDGEPVVECDYGSLHPFLICALHNMDASRFGGDIYTEMLPDNYVDNDRQLFKMALLFMLNCRSRDKALKAVQQEINFSNGAFSFRYATDVVGRIEQMLPEFVDFFYREDSYGLTLQNIDSNIMEEIMKCFIAAKKPLCPVHDSVVVRACDEGYAVDSMAKAFRKITGVDNPHFSIKVKRWDGSESLFKYN